MSFVPRRPPARSPPPVYEMPPSYGDPESQSSSSPPRLRPLSVSPTMSELELQTFGHCIPPLPFLFDPQVDPLSPSLSLHPLRNNFSRVHSFELPIPPSDSTVSGNLSNLPLASDISPISTSTRLSVFPTGPKPKGPHTKPAPASTRPPSPDVDLPDAKEFEIMVWTYGAPKKSSSSARKSKKVAKVEPISHGPITANTDMTWDYMVDTIANLLGTSPEFLVISSMEWRWLKPQNSPWLPLRNESGFASLIRQLLSPPKAVSGAYIIVKMDEPMKAPPTVSMPWVSQPAAGPSSGPGSFESTYRAVMGFNDEPSDDDGEQGKIKVSFDEGLEEEMERISNKYPPGTCSLHPDLECYHSRVTDLHFKLDRPKKIVWAAAIKKGTASLITPPLASNHFKASAALRNTAVNVTAAPPSTPAAPPPPPPPSTPATPAAPPTPYPTPYPYGPLPFPPSMGYPSFPPYHLPGLYGHPSHMLPWQDTPRAHRRRRSFDGSSPPQQSSSKRRREDRLPDPPSSPAFSGGSLGDFLSRYPDLPALTRAFLDDLGFEIGDDLSLVTEAQWKEGGLTLFGWNRIIKSYKKYKTLLRT
ncbi:hypothetical protein DFH08DRAFT_970131 [Mycena albidolilacea]|uniref:Uncharacterized protein n=1 Tax=Mycena albidolilacea TaxID=1033008 RepID=A0AAD7EH48_9AGAR|nr:hypothetical protein DFH08DRAFT_970131 [Mycena albidolilacea]